jgi:hypothetical protein
MSSSESVTITTCSRKKSLPLPSSISIIRRIWRLPIKTKGCLSLNVLKFCGHLETSEESRMLTLPHSKPLLKSIFWGQTLLCGFKYSPSWQLARADRSHTRPAAIEFKFWESTRQCGVPHRKLYFGGGDAEETSLVNKYSSLFIHVHGAKRRHV